MSDTLRPMGPMSTTFVQPGRDDPLGGIIATFTTWGACWMWDVTYHLSSDAWHVQHVVTDASVVGCDNTEAWLEDEPSDLRTIN